MKILNRAPTPQSLSYLFSAFVFQRAQRHHIIVVTGHRHATMRIRHQRVQSNRTGSRLCRYYERQENAFDQLSTEDLEEYGITEEFKAIQMLKLTQTFLLTGGLVSCLSEMRRVFEDDKVYDQVFRLGRLKSDARQILLCYKVQFRLRKLANEIAQKGQNKYWFVSKAR